jgi:hypothetical protein
MKSLKAILNRLGYQGLVKEAQYTERVRRANERLMAIEARTARKNAQREEANAERLRHIGRPEYISAQNAERKEALRQRWHDRRAWEAAGLARKRLERSRLKPEYCDDEA